MTELGPSSTAFVDWLFAQKPDAIVVPSTTGELSGAYQRFGVQQKIITRREFTDDYQFVGKWDAEGIWYIGFRRSDRPHL